MSHSPLFFSLIKIKEILCFRTEAIWRHEAQRQSGFLAVRPSTMWMWNQHAHTVTPEQASELAATRVNCSQGKLIPHLRGRYRGREANLLSSYTSGLDLFLMPSPFPALLTL